jgi:hypothetical protein
MNPQFYYNPKQNKYIQLIGNDVTIIIPSEKSNHFPLLSSKVEHYEIITLTQAEQWWIDQLIEVSIVDPSGTLYNSLKKSILSKTIML